MDKKIKKKFWTLKRISLYCGITLLVIPTGYELISGDHRKRIRVVRAKLTIALVERGVFQEHIPQTGIVEPSRSVQLDAIEGGTIKRLVAQSGAMLKAGDVILELSNLNRELAVLQQEAQLNESINQLRQTRLQLTQNDLQQQQMLADVERELGKLAPQYRRQKKLFEQKLISQQEFESIEVDFFYNLKRKEIVYKSYRNDSLERIRQLDDLNSSERRMQMSLEGSQKILDNLIIRTPVTGQLSRPQLDPGQNIIQGQSLGQVDVTGSYKVRVPIDELYLPRITTGLPATTTLNNRSYNLTISYIYPTIESNGRFYVDMDFMGEVPPGIRRGQSLRLHILLGQSSEELLLPMGGFYKDTGGNWAFVLEGNDQAVRRDIKLGRKSGNISFEVLEGLKPGDQVVTSGYENFGDAEVLILDNQINND
ncbi:MAG TPA: HlyD family efflux transporter periplasmic adaptor subunit [Chryseolinea sp.]|nr:HlyD family efflux transporter periplasmic adaptor subunit [Chryseolinea sp.]